jgi:hypothetical protein
LKIEIKGSIPTKYLVPVLLVVAFVSGVLGFLVGSPTPMSALSGVPDATTTQVGAWEQCGEGQRIFRASFGDKLGNDSVISNATIDDSTAALTMYLEVDGAWYALQYNGSMHPTLGNGVTTQPDYQIWGDDTLSGTEKTCPQVRGIHLHKIDFNTRSFWYSIPHTI